MRFASIVGTRPQFIKLAPVSQALRRRHEEVIIHTGQHYDDGLSGTFFRELHIPEPDYDLEIGSAMHGVQTGHMLEAIEAALVLEQPGGVIVYGDTNSTLAGALAAVKLHIPVAHVEAGLRSFNRAMPEEINRIVADHVANQLFCPTETARRHLSDEGIVDEVEVVGDVMYDLLLQVRPLLAKRTDTLLPKLKVAPEGYVLATIHRAANTDDPVRLHRIVQALDEVELPVVFPVHPRTRHVLNQHDIVPAGAVHLVDPVGYVDMLALEQNASHIVTDSGGVQKEAFLLGVPCVTLREDTEWPETLETGWNVLVDSDPCAIIEALARPTPEPPSTNLFGTGDAAARIVRLLHV